MFSHLKSMFQDRVASYHRRTRYIGAKLVWSKQDYKKGYRKPNMVGSTGNAAQMNAEYERCLDRVAERRARQEEEVA